MDISAAIYKNFLYLCSRSYTLVGSMSRVPEPRPVYTTPNASERTVVLWVSRHEPLPAQIRALEQKIGAIEVQQLVGIIPSAEFVAEVAQKLGAKIVVPVLPLSFIARLSELARRQGFTILMAKMREVARVQSREEAEKLVAEAPEWRTAVEYSGGVYRVWEFERFEKVIRVEVVTEPW